jgi:hypothetical protein
VPGERCITPYRFFGVEKKRDFSILEVGIHYRNFHRLKFRLFCYLTIFGKQVRRQQGPAHFEYEDESRGMMIDYSDHQPYREGSATPVLDCGDEERPYEGRASKLKLTEVAGDDYSPHNSDVYEDDYDIQYESGRLISHWVLHILSIRVCAFLTGKPFVCSTKSESLNLQS